MMKPGIARVAAYVQVAIAAGAAPTAVVAFLIALPFGWEMSAISSISVLIAAGGLSSLLIPLAGILISWCWRS